MTPRETLEQQARAAARAVYLGDDTLLATVLGGRLKMFLAASDIGIMPHLALDGFWESWVTIAVLRMVRPGMRVVNVGANVGYYALLFADLATSTGSVLAVEPNPELCALLEKSRHANGFWHMQICRAAAADAVSEGALVVPEGHAGNAHLGDIAGPDGRLVPTLVTTVDHLATNAWGRTPDVVFVDAEGAEERIWDGMVQTRARRDVVIVIEYEAKRYADPVGFVKKFEADGFTVGRIGEQGEILVTTAEALAAGGMEMVVLRRVR